MNNAVHDWFGLSYAAYLVLPRLVLQSMPDEWQERFTSMLNELEEKHADHLRGEYGVELLDADGRPTPDPLADYRHGKLL